MKETCQPPLPTGSAEPQPLDVEWMTQAKLDRQTSLPTARISAATHWRREYAIRQPDPSELVALERLIAKQNSVLEQPRDFWTRETWLRSAETLDMLEGQADAMRAALRSHRPRR